MNPLLIPTSRLHKVTNVHCLTLYPNPFALAAGKNTNPLFNQERVGHLGPVCIRAFDRHLPKLGTLMPRWLWHSHLPLTHPLLLLFCSPPPLLTFELGAFAVG